MRVDPDSVVDFARLLIARAADQVAAFPHVHVANLPGLTLEAAYTDPRLAAQVERALLEDPGDGIGSPRIHVQVGACADLPDWPKGRWAAPVYDTRAVTATLEAHGLFGLLDVDHAIWRFFDARRGLGVQVMADTERYPPWDATFPLRHFLHWACQSGPHRLIHAGTLGIDSHGVLIAGSGGAGKSGTTLAGIVAGMDSVGDDYVLVDVGDGDIQARPVLRMMKQDAAGLRRCGLEPGDDAFAETDWQSKHVFDFAALGRGRRPRALRVGAILLPTVTGRARTAVRRATPREAMLALAPSSLLQLLGGWHDGFRDMARIARRLPAYHLMLGTDPRDIADSVAGVLHGEAA